MLEIVHWFSRKETQPKPWPGVVGRDSFGVFPLRGKLLNVREAKHDQIMKNEEIQNIEKIMGLQHNKDYSNTASLRYGRFMIMTDQVGPLNNIIWPH